MKYSLTMLALCGALMLSPLQTQADVTFEVDPSAPWGGYMNVFESLSDPLNPGGYLWGSGWGVPDLVSVFTPGTLTLSPNTINDPAEYWYVGGGAPGSPGNKIMDANTYVELATGSNAGEVVTFQGNVQSNSLTTAHTARAFIRDFAPDYSSYNESTVDLTPGAFSIELFTSPDPGRHVQYGFNFNGPNVWITDVAPYGNVQIETLSSATPGDFNGDDLVDGRDFLIWQRGGSPSSLSATDLADWQANYGTGGLAAIAVPEPVSISLVAAVVGLLAFRRTGR